MATRSFEHEGQLHNLEEGRWSGWKDYNDGRANFKWVGATVHMLFAPYSENPNDNHVHVKKPMGAPRFGWTLCSVKTNKQHDFNRREFISTINELLHMDITP